MKEYRGKGFWAWTWKVQERKLWTLYKKARKGIYHLVHEVQEITDEEELKELLEKVEKVGVFSPRPYKLGQPCDGSIDFCVLALLFDFCKKKGLNWKELYREAYPGENPDDDINENFVKEMAEWQGVEYPKIWNEKAFEGLIESLTEINYHSFVNVLFKVTEEMEV